MQENSTIQMIGPGPAVYVTLLFSVGTHNLYGSLKGMIQMKHLKQHPALRAHLPVLVSERSESINASNGGRRDTSDGH